VSSQLAVTSNLNLSELLIVNLSLPGLAMEGLEQPVASLSLSSIPSCNVNYTRCSVNPFAQWLIVVSRQSACNLVINLVVHCHYSVFSSRPAVQHDLYNSRLYFLVREIWLYVNNVPTAAKAKSFRSRATRTQGRTLISVSIAFSQTPASWSCKSTDMGLVCRVECLFSSQLVPVPIYTAW